MWNLWLTVWHWDSFFIKYFSFHCQYHSINSQHSFIHQSCYVISATDSITNNTLIQTNKQLYPWILLFRIISETCSLWIWKLVRVNYSWWAEAHHIHPLSYKENLHVRCRALCHAEHIPVSANIPFMLMDKHKKGYVRHFLLLFWFRQCNVHYLTTTATDSSLDVM